MARIDYSAILGAVKSAVEAEVDGVDVVVEDEPVLGAAMTPWVGIYLDRRDPHEDQPIAAGRRTRYLLRISVWCWAFHLESFAQAANLRNDLIGRVEEALMKHRTLDGLVETSWLEGGEMIAARHPDAESIMAGGEIQLVADAVASY